MNIFFVFKDVNLLLSIAVIQVKNPLSLILYGLSMHQIFKSKPHSNLMFSYS